MRGRGWFFSPFHREKGEIIGRPKQMINPRPLPNCAFGETARKHRSSKQTISQRTPTKKTKSHKRTLARTHTHTHARTRAKRKQRQTSTNIVLKTKTYNLQIVLSRLTDSHELPASSSMSQQMLYRIDVRVFRQIFQVNSAQPSFKFVSKLYVGGI